MAPRIENYRVQLPFTQVVAGIKSTHREGALLHYTDHTIEVAPFPGFTTVKTKEAVEEVTAFLKDNHNPEKIEDLFHIEAPAHCLFALLQRFDQQSEVIDFTPKQNLLFSEEAWMTLDLENTLEKRLKFKLNTKDKELLTWIRDKKEILNKRGIKLRLDTNARWSAKKINTLWKNLSDEGLQEYIDYFEEPLKEFKDYSLLASNIPYAHEEYSDQFLLEPTKAQALVIKPSQSNWVGLQQENLRIIISSCWEGSFGASALKRLCQRYSDESHGLRATIDYSR